MSSTLPTNYLPVGYYLSMQDVDACKNDLAFEESSLPNSDLLSFSSYQNLQALLRTDADFSSSTEGTDSSGSTSPTSTYLADDELSETDSSSVHSEESNVWSPVPSPAPGWDKKSRYLLPARLHTIDENELPQNPSPAPPKTGRSQRVIGLGLGIGLGLPSSMIIEEKEEKTLLQSVRPTSKAKFASIDSNPEYIQAPIDASTTFSSLDALFGPGSLSPEWPSESDDSPKTRLNVAFERSPVLGLFEETIPLASQDPIPKAAAHSLPKVVAGSIPMVVASPNPRAVISSPIPEAVARPIPAVVTSPIPAAVVSPIPKVAVLSPEISRTFDGVFRWLAGCQVSAEVDVTAPMDEICEEIYRPLVSNEERLSEDLVYAAVEESCLPRIL